MRVNRVGAVAVIAFVCAQSAIAESGSRSFASSPRLTLSRLVDPAARIEVQGRVLRFALHNFIYFDTLDDLFAHIDREAGRWRFDSEADRQAFAAGLMRRGVESRVVSMETELPLEVVLTHTRAELARAAAATSTSHRPLVFKGRHWQLTTDAYREAFLRVRDRWSTSLNCWSAGSSIPARVLSNWYVIDEGIELYGATYDSTEHFWQAVKFHPDVTVGDLRALLVELMAIDTTAWVDALAADQRFYFANAYAVEFLKQNLAPKRLQWFHAELARVADAGERARTAQQRPASREDGANPRFSSLDEKVLWGDLADVFHLIVAFERAGAPRQAPALARFRESLVAKRFDGIYLDGYSGGRVGFLSPEFQVLMLEIWKVKYLKIPRLNEVIRSTAGRRLDHFLNDGDSPDIPIPVYVAFLNRIRDLAVETHR